ncbi:dihydrofolate reductase family protein [Actinoalloteichus hymeniacidonis]|uniref:Dihydrofolate reductase n=1 Tax=Actinoalloteichus hymeniacidonis TaxID=340345 RepID=A0AAC9HSD9_9PSEU|nr:dihydrofolate reductase family protein [Actinoalloteichus hymeniacidonis]AOS63590.1 dihydrofolate reductase [Actinoalloteichus hymeniacidonis]MBB5908364.1 dihydrofolate reductase [Actinoalloteichus hymeniacidonis]
MARLTVTTFLSLDGVVQGPGGPEEDTSGGFDQGGWTVPYADEDMGRLVSNWFAQSRAFLLGRKTYDIFAAYWPQVTDPDDPIAGPLNALPKHVVSRTLTDPQWQHSTVVGGDLTDAVRRLKVEVGETGELQVHGSPTLVQALLDDGLVDELRLLTFPVVLGAGRRLLEPGRTPTALRLVESSTTASGITANVYQPAGRPQYGSFD